MRKWLSATIISALLAYGAGSVVFTSRDVGRVWDERLYKDAGLIYLQQHHFADNHDHPPLSKWIAALYPYYSGDQSDEAFRYSHAVIYAAGGGVIAFQLLIWGYSYAAVIFAALFFLCPNLKAMASLNVLDSDLAVWMALAALYTWRGFSERRLGRQVFGLSLLQGFALMTKISALVYLPFFGLRIRQVRSRKTVALAVLGIFFATLLAYHFRFIEIGSYAASLGLQWKHSHIGHKIFLLGKSSERGFWYTYIVLFLLKNPLPTLIAVFAAMTFALRHPRVYRDAFVYWVAPAFVIGVLLSMGSVQLGFRYLLPSLVLLYLTTALVLDREVRTAALWRRRIGFTALVILGLSLLGTDVSTVSESAYLAYFNPLAPRPTRNFSDSNIDWLQGIPRHISKTLPHFIPLGEITATSVFSRPDGGPLSIDLGATDLCCGWGVWFPERELGPRLANAGHTVWAGAGHEIIEVTRDELCSAWRANDGARANDVLVVTSQTSQPNWTESKTQAAGLHPFLLDGKPEFHQWRAWIPEKDLGKVRFVNSKGEALGRELFKMIPKTNTGSCR